MQFLLTCLAACLMVPTVHCYNWGAPLEACNTLEPAGHTGSQAINKGNFGIIAERINKKTATVTINGAADYRGFLVALVDQYGSVQGDFTGTGVQNILCGATHNSPSPKNGQTLTVTSNQDFNGKVRFRVTVVQDRYNHVSGLTSNWV